MEDRKSLGLEKVPWGRRLSQDKLPSLLALLPPAWSPEARVQGGQHREPLATSPQLPIRTTPQASPQQTGLPKTPFWTLNTAGAAHTSIAILE